VYSALAPPAASQHTYCPSEASFGKVEMSNALHDAPEQRLNQQQRDHDAAPPGLHTLQCALYTFQLLGAPEPCRRCRQRHRPPPLRDPRMTRNSTLACKAFTFLECERRCSHAPIDGSSWSSGGPSTRWPAADSGNFA
jgi:hypothetical protein